MTPAVLKSLAPAGGAGAARYRGSMGRFVEPSAGGCGRRDNGCSVGGWIVTGPHLQSRRTPNREPWGIVHIKQNGALLTACGELAATWYVFWDHPFGVEVAGSCPACVRAMHDPAHA